MWFNPSSPSFACTMSELSQAETDAEQTFNEVLQADDAANSQHPSPAASVIALSSASDEDYEELGDVVEQLCGAGYYEKNVRLASYKSKCKKLKAENYKLRKDRDTLLKQCQNWRAKCISLANPAVHGKSTTKEDHQSLIHHQRPIQRHQKQIAFNRKHQSSSSKSMQPKVAIGQSPNCAIKSQQEDKRRHAIRRARALAKVPPKPPPPPRPPWRMPPQPYH